MMSALTQPNDISDNLNDRISSYQAPLGNSQMGMEQIHQNGNSFPGNNMGYLNMPNMIDSQGYARSQMSYPARGYGGRYWKSSRRDYYDDDDDDDDYDDDDDDEDVDEEEERGRPRSYVNRRHYYDDEDDEGDEDDDRGDEIVYTRRFDRKDNIAKIPKKRKIKPSSKRKVH